MLLLSLSPSELQFAIFEEDELQQRSSPVSVHLASLNVLQKEVMCLGVPFPLSIISSTFFRLDTFRDVLTRDVFRLLSSASISLLCR